MPARAKEHRGHARGGAGGLDLRPRPQPRRRPGRPDGHHRVQHRPLRRGDDRPPRPPLRDPARGRGRRPRAPARAPAPPPPAGLHAHRRVEPDGRSPPGRARARPRRGAGPANAGGARPRAGERTLSYRELEEAPTASPTACARPGWDATSPSPSACPARPSSWWPCSPSSRRAAPTSPSTPPYPPPPAFAFMLADTSAPVLITTEALAPMLRPGPRPSSSSTGPRPSSPLSRPRPGGGGAHGRPRLRHLHLRLHRDPEGVMIEHRALSNHMCWMQETFRFTPADRILQRTPSSFDASVWEFWAPLLVGASLVLPSWDDHITAADLVEALALDEVTVLQLVPTLLRIFLDEPDIDRCASLRSSSRVGRSCPASLRSVSSSASAPSYTTSTGRPKRASMHSRLRPSQGSTARLCPLVGRSRTRASTCSTAGGSRCRWASRVSSTSGAPGSRAAT